MFKNYINLGLHGGGENPQFPPFSRKYPTVRNIRIFTVFEFLYYQRFSNILNFIVTREINFTRLRIIHVAKR